MGPFNKKVTATKNYLTHLEDAIFWHNTYILRKKTVKNINPQEYKEEYNSRLRLMIEALQERNHHLSMARSYKDKTK